MYIEDLVLKRASNYDGINLLSTGLYEYDCDLCKKNIKSNRFHCVTCDNYDLCKECFVNYRNQHCHYHLFKKSEGEEFSLELDDISTITEKIVERYKLYSKCVISLNKKRKENPIKYETDNKLINDFKYFLENNHNQRYLVEHALFITFREISKLRNEEFNEEYEFEKEKKWKKSKFLFCIPIKKPKDIIRKISYSKEIDLNRIIHGTACYNYDKNKKNNYDSQNNNENIIENMNYNINEKFLCIFLACFNSYTLQHFLYWIMTND